MRMENPGYPGFFFGMDRLDDTIAAAATPPGTGGVAIIRVSGLGSAEILEKVFSAQGPFDHGVMRYGNVISDGRTIDTGYAVFFKGPRSYTGEDTVELHVHGGQVTTAGVLRAVIRAGARPAQPGEFTKRAFLNGRMDLSQAQAVGDLIGALSEAGAELALRQTKDALKKELNDMSETMLDMIAQMEAVLEYPDEDVADISEPVDAGALRAMGLRLAALADTAAAGKTIRDGLRVAFAGAPNTGKSSLFNRLCGDDVAIVTDVPGTTRDCLRETITIEGAAVHLCDTAGLRDASDLVEEEGVRRSVTAARKSSLVLFMVDQSRSLNEEDRAAWNRVSELGVPCVCVLSKSDLPRVLDTADLKNLIGDVDVQVLSAHTGEGIETLRAMLRKHSCADALREETVLISDLRQSEHLCRAAEAVSSAVHVLESGLDEDFVCSDLRSACHEIGCITGQFADEDVIDRIFSKFCLGK